MTGVSGFGETEGGLKQRIISLLHSSPDTYISGEEISSVLGITRSAVWKHIEHLREEGYVIDSVSRKGYKIVSRPDILYPGEILKGLQTKVFGREIHHFPLIDSTNDRAKEIAETGAPEGTVVLAEGQTGGRGRMERPWKSPPGGIWMSVILRPPIPPHMVPGLTLVAAVAVVQGVKEVTGLKPLIKWPNDIYVEGRKICGILTEMKAEMDRVHHIVIGIGVNANVDPSELEKEAPNAGSLVMFLPQQVDRKKLVREILFQLEEYYLVFCGEGVLPILEVWRNNNFTLGHKVVLKQDDQEISGVAEDISPEGGLLLRDDKGEIRLFYSGEVTVIGHNAVRESSA